MIKPPLGLIFGKHMSSKTTLESLYGELCPMGSI